MPRRCSTNRCPNPRANWWRQALGVNWLSSSQGVTPYTPSAELQAWMDQVTTDGGTLPTLIQQQAIDAFLASPLETGTVRSRMKTGYFFHFGNSLTWRRNIKDPTTYRTTITGTLHSSSQGIWSNGTDGHIDQPFKTDEYAGIEGDLTCCQLITGISGDVNSSAASHGFRTRSDVVSGFYNKPVNITNIGAADNQSETVSNYASFNHAGRYIHLNNGTTSIVFKNGVKTSAALVPSAPNISNNRIILGRNNRGSTGTATIAHRYTYPLALDFLFDELTDADASALDAAIEEYAVSVGLTITDAQFNTYMDQLNLQSDDAANFTIVSNAVSQWNDLSGSGRHATQGTAANRPAYASGIVTFDGSNDSLTLASEIDRTEFSMYILIQKPVGTGSYVPIGSSSRLDFLQLTAARQASVFKAAGGFTPFMYGNEEYYTVVSLRMSGGSVTMNANDRKLMNLSSTLTSGSFRIGKLGSSSSGSAPFAGVIRAVCVSSQYFDDATNALIVDKLLSKYPYPLSTNVSLLGFGDSITQGATPPGLTSPWLNQVATSQALPYCNLGIGGTQFTNYASDEDNGYDRYAAQLITKPYKDKIVILYGTNDVATVSAANFETQYSAMVADLIQKGYNPRNITLCTLVRSIGDAGSVAKQAYNTVIANVASTYGTRLADVYAAFVADSDPDALMADTTHPNQAGHDLIATTVNTAMAGA
jgi:lysophospholipase L1-like esterase